MKIVDGKKYYTVGEVCKIVKRSYSTVVGVWYKAQEYALETGEHFPFKLPEYRRDLDLKTTRYWDEEGVQQLLAFRDSIQTGDLAFYTEPKMRGERGKQARQRRLEKQHFDKQLKSEGIDLEKTLEEWDPHEKDKEQ